MLSHGASHVAEPYEPEHLEGAVLVFAATGDEALDRRISWRRARVGIPVNAVDRPDLCDFFTPALVNRAPLAVAIGTEGAGPVLAQMIRAHIDRLLSPSLGPLAALANSLPRCRRAPGPEGRPRRRLLERVLLRRARARHGSRAMQQRRAARRRDLLSRSTAVEGHVALVGAGPGAEDLLTLRAQRLLMEADVIVL